MERVHATVDEDGLQQLFHAALEYVKRARPDEWADLQRRYERAFESWTVDEFLEDYAWVVYAAGFKESTIEKLWPRLKAAWHDFSLEEVASMDDLSGVLAVFNRVPKAEAVRRGARLIKSRGFNALRAAWKVQGPEGLMILPGIGVVTKDHLARNVRLADVAKNDLWLRRVVRAYGAESHTQIVDFLAGKTGVAPGVVDMVIWRYCADEQWTASP